jgi:hypothetical protein
MAHFAKINQDNIVVSVIVANDLFIKTLEDKDLYVQTSYNTREGIHYESNSSIQSKDQSKALRKNFAGIGYFYDESRDAFIPPKTFNSWILDDFSCIWIPPIQYPNNGKLYIWNEEKISWEEIKYDPI